VAELRLAQGISATSKATLRHAAGNSGAIALIAPEPPQFPGMRVRPLGQLSRVERRGVLIRS
jgi:hypothetical protein